MTDGPCDANAYFYVGVFTPDRPDVDRLTSVLRSATEDVLLPALTVTDHVTELRAVRRGEDLSTERPARGLVWDVIERADSLEDVMITATRPSRGRAPEPPFMIVHARPPGPWRRLDGTPGETDTVVDFSIRLAEMGGGVPPDLAARVVSWVEQARREINASTGYATVDQVQAGPTAMSPYEMAVMAPPAARESRHQVVGYGWGTLLGPDHVALLGGQASVEAAPVHRRIALDATHWWLELDHDPCRVSREAVANLRRYLSPLLRTGTQEIEDAAGLHLRV